MWLFGVVWQLSNIVAVLFVFSKLEGRIEFIAVSILGLIYVAIRSGTTTVAIDLRDLRRLVIRESENIRGLVDQDFVPSSYSREEEATASKYERVEMLIQALGLFAIGAICLAYLVATLLDHPTYRAF